MAAIFENSRNFKVIAFSMDECREWPRAERCDNCNTIMRSTGFYVPAVNSIFCTECYNDWSTQAGNIPHDNIQEKKCIERAKQYLNISGINET